MIKNAVLLGERHFIDYFAFFIGRRVFGSIAAQTITAKIPVSTVVGSIYELL